MLSTKKLEIIVKVEKIIFIFIIRFQILAYVCWLHTT